MQAAYLTCSTYVCTCVCTTLLDFQRLKNATKHNFSSSLATYVVYTFFFWKLQIPFISMRVWNKTANFQADIQKLEYLHTNNLKKTEMDKNSRRFLRSIKKGDACSMHKIKKKWVNFMHNLICTSFAITRF